jgi:hypothetical protein
MMELSYRRHRFPPVVIQDAVWLYLRFTLSYRDAEDLLAERRLDISYETVRSWVLKFGRVITRRLRRRRPRPGDRWHGTKTSVLCHFKSTRRSAPETATRRTDLSSLPLPPLCRHTPSILPGPSATGNY